MQANKKTQKGPRAIDCVVELRDRRLNLRSTAASAGSFAQEVSKLVEQPVHVAELEFASDSGFSKLSSHSWPAFRQRPMHIVRVAGGEAGGAEPPAEGPDPVFFLKRNSTTVPAGAQLSRSRLQRLRAHPASPSQRVAMNAVMHGKLSKILIDHERLGRLHGTFSNELDVDVIASDQRSSGRCWIFAFTNMLRLHMVHHHKLPASFELSHVYLSFYDLLEKANLFLSQMWAIRDRHPLTDPYARQLLQEPISDGGQWHMLQNLVHKYGVVPAQCMKETAQSNATGRLNDLLKSRLREGARAIMDAPATAKPEDTIRPIVDAVHDLLVIFLGKPPTTVQWEYSPGDGGDKKRKKRREKQQSEGTQKKNNKKKKRTESEAGEDEERKKDGKASNKDKESTAEGTAEGTKDNEDKEDKEDKEGKEGPKRIQTKKYREVKGLTPLEFYAKYVKPSVKVDDYVCAINYPHPERPMHRWYTVKCLNNVVGGREALFLNVHIDEMKALVRSAIDAGEPVWFAADVGKDMSMQSGTLDPHVLDYESALGYAPHTMDKGERMMLHDGTPDHAMLIKGYHKSKADGAAVEKWLVENSWGEDTAHKGNLVMSDAWFERHMYNVAVHKRHLQKVKDLKAFDGSEEVIEMEPWDTFGGLF